MLSSIDISLSSNDFDTKSKDPKDTINVIDDSYSQMLVLKLLGYKYLGFKQPVFWWQQSYRTTWTHLELRSEM